jgi:hypothetical protein
VARETEGLHQKLAAHGAAGANCVIEESAAQFNPSARRIELSKEFDTGR